MGIHFGEKDKANHAMDQTAFLSMGVKFIKLNYIIFKVCMCYTGN